MASMRPRSHGAGGLRTFHVEHVAILTHNRLLTMAEESNLRMKYGRH